MSEIRFIEKPDWITWSQIRDCIYQAHSINRKKNIYILNSEMSDEEFAERYEKNQNLHCFVALDGDRVVGVQAVKFVKMNRWWAKGKRVAYTCLDGILPAYRGTDVFLGLDRMRMKCITDSGVRIIQCNRAENNKSVLKLCKLGGFKYVQYSATGKGATYYSVIMVKWLDGCPYSDTFCIFMYKLSKFFVKTFWKPGYVFRFWF